MDYANCATVYKLLGDSFIVSIFCIVAAIFVAIGLYRLEKRWPRLWKFFEQNLTFCFLCTWIFGFCVYTVGMFVSYDSPEAPSHDFVRLMMVAPMAIVHAFEMFIFSSDISAVHGEFHNNVWYMLLYSLAHFLAALVSLIFVIKHFGYNVITRIQLLITCRFGSKKDDLFVFWGQNEPSFHLAKDIKKHHPRPFRILFVKTSDDEETAGNPTGLGRLFNFLSMKNKELDELKEIQCLSLSAFRRLSKCELSAEEREKANASVLCDKIGLHSIARIFNVTDKHVYVFMLGDDEDSNIKAASNICADKHLNAFVKARGDRKCVVYCHARYDSVSKVIENERFADNLRVKIIDSAHMSIDMLKGSTEMLCQPVHFVDVNDDATVSTKFNAMVIGFGQCGRDALKFLYEYGAFVSKDKDVRSPFHCDVFDNNMNEIGPYFKSVRPGADIRLLLNDDKNGDGEEKKDEEKESLVHLHEMDIHNQQFWSVIDEKIFEENYIVISVKDDEAGVTLAVRLLKHAIRKGADIERLRIFVRSYRYDILPHMEAIARFYNDSVVNSLGLRTNKKPIYIFGSVSDIYTWHNIVDDSLQKQSYRYYDSYEGIEESEENLGNAWRERRESELGSHPYGYANINSVRRKEMQDMENALHRNVKVYLMQKAFNNDDAFNACAKAISEGSLVRYEYDSLGKRIQSYGKDYKGTVYKLVDSEQPLSYMLLDEDDRRKIILDSLACTEHIRWKASHEMLGYAYGAVSKEERETRMIHDCIVSWSSLKSDETKGYDYSVIDTSLKLYYAEKQQDDECNEEVKL